MDTGANESAETTIDHHVTRLDRPMSIISGLAHHDAIFDLAESFPPLPATVSRLATIIADPRSEVEDVTAILREDPMVVATLLREANSAASAPVNPITTVEAAVMRLGLARVLAVATSSGIPAKAHSELTSYNLSAGELWSHSIRASYVAEAIHRTSRDLAGPEVVTAALLHDIGQMVLDEILDPRFFREARISNIQITTAERELVDVDHAELGAMLLELWGIPDSIATAVRFHHEPDLCETMLAHVVSLSDLLVHELTGELSDHSDDGPGRIEQSLETLGLDHQKIVDKSTMLLDKAGLMPEPKTECD